MLVNACKEHKYRKVFSNRNRIRKEVYDRMVARWKEFGLDGQPPEIRAFEGEDVSAGAGSNGTRSGEAHKEQPGLIYM